MANDETRRPDPPTSGASRIRELEAELDLTRRLFRLDDVPMLTLDDRGTILSTNGRWFGQTAPPCVGQPLWELFHRSCREDLHEGAATGWLGVSALHLQLLSGRNVTLSVVSTGPGTWLAAIRDISRLRMLDDAIELNRSVGAVADVAGAVSRELTDPLSVIQGRLELLRLRCNDPGQAEQIDNAYDHARHVAGWLRNLRLVSRATASGFQQVDVGAVVHDAVELLGGRHDRVVVDLEPELGAGGDAAVYARVVSTLLRCALGGAGASRVLVRARTHRDGAQIEVGPVGRPRGEPDASRMGLVMEELLLRTVGGVLLSWRRGEDQHFEVRLPRPPSLPRAPRPLGQQVLLVGSLPFHEAVQHVLSLDGFDFHCVSSPSEALDMLEGCPEVNLVGVELIQPHHGNGIELAEGMVHRHPELAGGVMVAGPGSQRRRLGGGVVGVSWPIRRREWVDVARRRARGA